MDFLTDSMLSWIPCLCHERCAEGWGTSVAVMTGAGGASGIEWVEASAAAPTAHRAAPVTECDASLSVSRAGTASGNSDGVSVPGS